MAPVKALLFDFGGTLAFLDYELLAREFSRPGHKLDALALEYAEYAGRESIDRFMMSERNPGLNFGYEQFFRAWLGAAGIQGEEILAPYKARDKRQHGPPPCPKDSVSSRTSA